jgi:peptidoglycan/xylan/chitin deacetylase (PgdA/CDA1 family)
MTGLRSAQPTSERTALAAGPSVASAPHAAFSPPLASISKTISQPGGGGRRPDEGPITRPISRRQWLVTAAGAAVTFALRSQTLAAAPTPRAQIAITLDLEMSAEYPRRGMTEWNFEKGNLDQATKDYSVKAANVVADRGGRIHFFLVGRVLEQPDVDWLKQLIDADHPIGNHTYDHVYLLAKTPEETQFRFRRSPWLIEGQSVDQILRTNIRMTTDAMRRRLGIDPAGFRTPGGFQTALDGRPDLQQMLKEEGFTWVSSRYPAHKVEMTETGPAPVTYEQITAALPKAQPAFYPDGLLEIPMSPISDVGAFRTHRWKLDWFLEAIRVGVTWAIDHGATFDFLAHPSCLGIEDPDCASLKLICDLVERSNGKAELVTLNQIAERQTRG